MQTTRVAAVSMNGFLGEPERVLNGIASWCERAAAEKAATGESEVVQRRVEHLRRGINISDWFAQASYGARFEWGPAGAEHLAPASAGLVIVDVLSFSTAVTVAVEAGIRVFPYPRHDDAAAAFARRYLWPRNIAPQTNWLYRYGRSVSGALASLRVVDAYQTKDRHVSCGLLGIRARRHTRDFIIVKPTELLKRLDAIHGKTNKIKN